VQTATQDADWWVRETAIEAVAPINDARAVPYLVHIHGSEPDLQPVCIQGAHRHGGQHRGGPVAPLCRSDSADVRYLAVKFLQKLDCSDHAAAVAKLHEDPNLKVRALAREAIAKWRVTAQGQAAHAVPLLDRLLVQLAQQEGDDLIIASGGGVHEEGGTVTPLTPAGSTRTRSRRWILPHLSTNR